MSPDSRALRRKNRIGCTSRFTKLPRLRSRGSIAKRLAKNGAAPWQPVLPFGGLHRRTGSEPQAFWAPGPHPLVFLAWGHFSALLYTLFLPQHLWGPPPRTAAQSRAAGPSSTAPALLTTARQPYVWRTLKKTYLLSHTVYKYYPNRSMFKPLLARNPDLDIQKTEEIHPMILHITSWKNRRNEKAKRDVNVKNAPFQERGH